MSNDSDTLAFILRVLRVFDGFRGPSSDSIWWRTDGEYAPVTFMVICNDEFDWASADCERITPENIAVLEQAVADCVTADNVIGSVYAPTLFVARVRGMRPQGAAYPPEIALWPLFDACGPERAVGPTDPGNTPRRTGTCGTQTLRLSPDRWNRFVDILKQDSAPTNALRELLSEA